MNSLLFTAVTPFVPSDQANQQLVSLAIFYIRRAKNNFQIQLPLTEQFVNWDEIAPETSSIDLFALAQKIRKGKKITDYPLAAMLACNFEGVSPHLQTLNDLKALGVMVFAWYLATGRSFQDLKKFCYAIRTMTTKKGQWLLKLIPNSISSPDELVAALEAQQSNVPFGEIRRFKEFLHPLKSLVDNRSANGKSEQQLSDKGDRANRPHIEAKQGKIWFGDQKVTFLVDLPEQINPSIAQEEQTHDHSKPSLTIEINDQHSSENKRSQTEREIRGQDIANAITRKSIKSIFDWGHLSGNEISRLFRHQFYAAQGGNVTALFLCISILTGRRVEDLIRLKLKKREKTSKGDQWVVVKEFICLVSVLNLPENSGDQYVSVRKDIYLPIPLALSGTLREILNDGRNKDIDFSSHLSLLNRHFKNRLSQNRLAEISQRFYIQQGVQKPIIAAITGQTAKHNPSLFYCGLERHTVSSTYQRFINYIKTLTHLTELSLPEAKSNQLIGSNSIALDKVVQQRFTTIKTAVKNARNWHTCHNALTFYTHEVLSLATGHRAVGSPFEKITDFDLNHGQIWICDKENRQEQSSRILPLAPIARNQVLQYINHLHASQYYHSLLQPELATEIDNSLSGKSDFLFFITGDKLLPVAPNIVTEMENLVDLPNLKGNWARHFLYSKLIAKDCCPHAISNFFGHADFGEEAGNPFSHFSMQRYADLAAKIQSLLTGLQIEKTSGWQETNI
ncbi:hypothetical protein [Terasakiella sp.]|uniref:hypothetical protein n=1 Tax=Terasakiella sp. TaxID=2034861 RepID=UPI003AA8E6C8